LQALGVRGRCIEWIKAFLSARTFVVRVGSHFSLEKSVASGVPQGSVLGPILFLAYTSDLLLSLQTGYSAYADDLKLFGCPTDKECDLQHKVNILYEWCINWKLPLNTNKCTVMHFGKKKSKDHI
jgi:ribonuclease P/MRP protein subunit RPP40